VVKDAEATIPQLQRSLAGRGITVTRMEKIRPSLEDVFVSLTTGREAAEEHKP
jgi:ABC-2 type transport system ATP-binding protein